MQSADPQPWLAQANGLPSFSAPILTHREPYALGRRGRVLVARHDLLAAIEMRRRGEI